MSETEIDHARLRSLGGQAGATERLACIAAGVDEVLRLQPYGFDAMHARIQSLSEEFGEIVARQGGGTLSPLEIDFVKKDMVISMLQRVVVSAAVGGHPSA